MPSQAPGLQSDEKLVAKLELGNAIGETLASGGKREAGASCRTLPSWSLVTREEDQISLVPRFYLGTPFRGSASSRVREAEPLRWRYQAPPGNEEFRRAALSFRRATLSFCRAALSFRRATLSFCRAALSLRHAALSFRRVALSFRRATLSFRCAALSFCRAALSFCRAALSFRITSSPVPRPQVLSGDIV